MATFVQIIDICTKPCYNTPSTFPRRRRGAYCGGGAPAKARPSSPRCSSSPVLPATGGLPRAAWRVTRAEYQQAVSGKSPSDRATARRQDGRRTRAWTLGGEAGRANESPAGLGSTPGRSICILRHLPGASAPGASPRLPPGMGEVGGRRPRADGGGPTATAAAVEPKQARTAFLPPGFVPPGRWRCKRMWCERRGTPGGEKRSPTGPFLGGKIPRWDCGWVRPAFAGTL